MKYLLPIILSLTAMTSILIAANEHKDDHPHKKTDNHSGEHADKHTDGHEHQELGERKAGHGEHGHDKETPRFGPTKGVTEANARLGFKLNVHAFENFKIEVLELKGAGSWKVPRSALVYSREETHVYRYKDGFFKSIDIKVHNKSREMVTISASDLKSGDRIASQGTGFLTIVDQAVFGEELAHEH